MEFHGVGSILPKFNYQDLDTEDKNDETLDIKLYFFNFLIFLFQYNKINESSNNYFNYISNFLCLSI